MEGELDGEKEEREDQMKKVKRKDDGKLKGKEENMKKGEKGKQAFPTTSLYHFTSKFSKPKISSNPIDEK